MTAALLNFITGVLLFSVLIMIHMRYDMFKLILHCISQVPSSDLCSNSGYTAYCASMGKYGVDEDSQISTKVHCRHCLDGYSSSDIF
jgi:hypothetical protein